MEITSERITILIAFVGFVLAGISFAYNVKSEVTVLRIELQSNIENDRKSEESVSILKSEIKSEIKSLTKECKRIDSKVGQVDSRIGQVAQGLVAVEQQVKHLKG